MRNVVKKKLHSQAGASVLIALLFFLAAMTVGAVVLTAASTNAGRLARNRQEQQDYLAVASAAMLVKEDFRGTVFTVGYQETTVTSVDGEGNLQRDVYYNKTSPALSGKSGLLEDRPENDLARLYYSTVAALNEAAPGEMNYPLEIRAAGLPDVFGAMTVDQTDGARYTVTVMLYTQAEDGTHTNATTLLFTPAVSNTQSTGREYGAEAETVQTTCTTTVAWGAPTVTKGAAA